LDGREIVALHLLLKSREEELDETLHSILTKTEKLLYERLSVEELEGLADLYRQKLDILKEKG
jgi:hypothetical protein